MKHKDSFPYTSQLTPEQLGALTLCAVQSPHVTYSQPSAPTVPPYLWFYIHGFNLQRILLCSTIVFTIEKKKKLCKLTSTVQIHIVQGSGVISFGSLQ